MDSISSDNSTQLTTKYRKLITDDINVYNKEQKRNLDTFCRSVFELRQDLLRELLHNISFYVGMMFFRVGYLRDSYESTHDRKEEQCVIFYSLYNNKDRIMDEMFAVATRQVCTLLKWERPYPGMVDQAKNIIHEIFWVWEIKTEYEKKNVISIPDVVETLEFAGEQIKDKISSILDDREQRGWFAPERDVRVLAASLLKDPEDTSRPSTSRLALPSTEPIPLKKQKIVWDRAV
ncbi:unnamed protein product [Orchesella dallaii]|uniref:Uncharacterized protein n=1 Tax=Orchesella dallaii TaxID=48710 RepID=A0ABP1RLV3_9HEXA